MRPKEKLTELSNKIISTTLNENMKDKRNRNKVNYYISQRGL